MAARLALALLITLALVSPRSRVQASSDISDLGKPTTDAPANTYDPLANFARLDAAKAVRGKVRLVLFDTAWDNSSAAGRWPMVKALDQFGAWSGLQKGSARVAMYPPEKATNGGVQPGWPPLATFDFDHARFTSRYVTFVHRIVQVRRGGPHLRLPISDATLLNHVLRLPGITDPNMCIPTCSGFVPTLPAVVVGRYGMHGLAYMPSPTLKMPVMTFDALQKTLQAGDDPMNYWIKEFNTYVNIVTAFVCHEDGGMPRSVCSRHTISYILSAIKSRIK